MPHAYTCTEELTDLSSKRFIQVKMNQLCVSHITSESGYRPLQGSLSFLSAGCPQLDA